MDAQIIVFILVCLLNVTYASKMLRSAASVASVKNTGSLVTSSRTRVERLSMGIRDSSEAELDGLHRPKSPHLIIAGAPAAGKGTQCEKIVERLGVVHLSTGDILRAAVREGTDLGIKVSTSERIYDITYLLIATRD